MADFAGFQMSTLNVFRQSRNQMINLRQPSAIFFPRLPGASIATSAAPKVAQVKPAKTVIVQI